VSARKIALEVRRRSRAGSFMGGDGT